MLTRSDRSPAAVTRHHLAWLCTLLMLVVVTASAFMRHHADAAGHLISFDQMVLVRQLHRVAATLVLLGSVAMIVLARRAGDKVAVALACTLLGIAVLLSVVGIAGGASKGAPVVLVNLLGGYAMLALWARLATARPARSLSVDVRGAARWLLALLVVQVVAGGWASSHVSAQCIVLDDCAWRTVLHRIGGVLIGNGLLLFGLMASFAGRRCGQALLLVAVLSMLTGMAAAALGILSVPRVVVLHNGFAAVTIALLLCLMRR